MIQVLLLILKIIGIVLAILLVTVLTLLFVVLFVPVFYRVKVKYLPEKKECLGKAGFLSPLVVFKFRYFEEEFSYRGRALWYVFADSGKNKEEMPEEKAVKKEKTSQPAEESDEKTSAETEYSGETEEILEKIQPFRPQEEPVKIKKKESKKKEKQKTEKNEEKKPGFLEKIKRLFRQKDEVVRILSKAESKQAVSFAWGKLKKTLKHILPRKVKGYLVYGSGDPATTGQVLGVISVLYAAMGPVLNIVPDFENKRLECDLEFKGRLQVFTLLVILIKVYFHKELKQLIAEIKGIREIE